MILLKRALQRAILYFDRPSNLFTTVYFAFVNSKINDVLGVNFTKVNKKPKYTINLQNQNSQKSLNTKFKCWKKTPNIFLHS
jgi:hypothetical protein